MKFYVLASGSKGNCCVVMNHDTKIVIDCGSTQKYLKECFKKIECDIAYIDPPYNTGNDFIYNDDFSSSTDESEIK